MPKEPKANINIKLAEVAKLLCPKCKQELKKLLAEKIAEKAMKE